MLVLVSIEHKSIEGVYILPHELNNAGNNNINSNNNAIIVTPVEHYYEIGARVVSVVWRMEGFGE